MIIHYCGRTGKERWLMTEDDGKEPSVTISSNSDEGQVGGKEHDSSIVSKRTNLCYFKCWQMFHTQSDVTMHR